VWAIAGIAAVLISAAIIGHVVSLAIFGAPWFGVPESPNGPRPPGSVTYEAVSAMPILLFSASAGAVIVGIGARFRGGGWGLFLAWAGGLVLAGASIVFIFGVFGPIFFAALSLLIVLSVFTWFGRGMSDLD
jgi:hypothetical protein